MTAKIYRSDLVSLKTYRLSPALVGFGRRWILPVVLGKGRKARRSQYAWPTARERERERERAIARVIGGSLGTMNDGGEGEGEEEEEVVTTASPSASATPPSPSRRAPGASARSRAAAADALARLRAAAQADTTAVAASDPSPELPPPSTSTTTSNPGRPSPQSSMQEWMQELSSSINIGPSRTRMHGGLRIPGEEEIAHLSSVFPDMPREVVVGALQRRYDSFPSLLFFLYFC
jgi:hypothetical protein